MPDARGAGGGSRYFVQGKEGFVIKAKLKKFFDEKQLPENIFIVEKDQLTHVIDFDTLIDLIVNVAPENEQAVIWNMISKIDFLNGDISHYLNHLATAYIMENF
ncbi:hypothetical protein ACFOQM_10780 [Paenibacillus sp. GCM10012307]|uniref:Uncharacterized protein n=1 Tax=Paenibacillus roseus TaxID=2798579 RepID=A0A934J1W4_9BACL|nr:hypothetical protein [Paenibacillus roseus]MBJ6361769.1 hypothetical protein [Paenibacillus roseus]